MTGVRLKSEPQLDSAYSSENTSASSPVRSMIVRFGRLRDRFTEEVLLSAEVVRCSYPPLGTDSLDDPLVSGTLSFGRA